jgi:hypothetical protein
MQEDPMPMTLRLMIPILVLACPASPAFADAITDWNEKAVALVTPRMAPPVAQRAVAIVQVAMFDAVNSIDRRYRPYLVQLPAETATSREATAAAAAARALVGLLPQLEGDIRAALTAYAGAIPDDPGKQAGLSLGETVAARILAACADDGANAADAYRPRTKPGVYVPTPITVGSTWPQVKPFAMTSAAQFRPQPPIPLAGEQWTADYNEIKDLGGKSSARRSARQTEDARFWLITGPQSTDPIARQLVSIRTWRSPPSPWPMPISP